MTVEDERFAAITATLDEALSGLREVPWASLSNADRRVVYLRLDVVVRSPVVGNERHYFLFNASTDSNS